MLIQSCLCRLLWLSCVLAIINNMCCQRMLAHFSAIQDCRNVQLGLSSQLSRQEAEDGQVLVELYRNPRGSSLVMSSMRLYFLKVPQGSNSKTWGQAFKHTSLSWTLHIQTTATRKPALLIFIKRTLE